MSWHESRKNARVLGWGGGTLEVKVSMLNRIRRVTY